jgi:alkylation response protein AidB-like acyl-CoA dehydrogenase
LCCTNGTIADLMVVMARTGPKKITAFNRGRRLARRRGRAAAALHGLKGIENGIIRFTNVKVPEENVLWGEGRGCKLALVTLNTGRPHAAGLRVAGAKRCLEDLRAVGLQRVQWGQPWAGTTRWRRRSAAWQLRPSRWRRQRPGVTHGRSGDVDIRLEAALAEDVEHGDRVAIVDDTLQIKGGRGLRDSRQPAARGRERRSVRARCCATSRST